MVTTTAKPTIEYPSEDGQPLAETAIHINAIISLVVPLKQHLQEREAIVLSNQFVYYVENFPRLRFAPDVAVVFDVPPGDRNNYKIWEEGQVPAVIFEITSKSTQRQDQVEKKLIYDGLGVQEYWLFDPHGEWIVEQLRGYRWNQEEYISITDGCSQVLGLRLAIEGHLLGLYRLDTGERLLLPDELKVALAAAQEEMEVERQRAEVERQRADAERQRAEAAEAELAQLQERLAALGVDPEDGG